MMAPAWTTAYIGIPFVPNGRTALGCDCYGLVRLVLMEQYGIEWPLFASDYAIGDRETEEALIDVNRPLLCGHELQAPEPGAVVLLRYLNRVSHMGLYVGSNALLHTEPRVSSCIVPLTSVNIRNRIAGYYRVN